MTDHPPAFDFATPQSVLTDPHIRRMAVGEIVADLKAGLEAGDNHFALLDLAFHRLILLSLTTEDAAGRLPDAALAGLALAVQREGLRIFKNELKDL